MNDSTLNDLLGGLFSPPTGLRGGQQESPDIRISDLLGRNKRTVPQMMSNEYLSPEDEEQLMMMMQEGEPEEEESKWGKLLKRLFLPLTAVGSIPDVLHDTDFSNPASVMAMPLRYGRNIVTGVAGQAGIGDPDYNSLEDFMDKYGIMEGSAAKPWVALGGEMLLDPTTYLGGTGAIKKVAAKGAAKTAKKGALMGMVGKSDSLSSMYK